MTHKVHDVLESLVLHLPAFLKPLNLRRKVVTLSLKPLLRILALFFRNGVRVHRRVGCSADELHCLRKVFQKRRIMQVVCTDNMQLPGHTHVRSIDHLGFLNCHKQLRSEICT